MTERIPTCRTSLLCAALLAAACGAGTQTAAPAEGSIAHHVAQAALTADNGLSLNGIATNGIATNGIATNGLALNGIATNGIATNGLNAAALTQGAFATWFGKYGASYADMVMRYVVRCALPAGQTMSYTFGGVAYSWPGDLGLAPVWASGHAIPLAEQQLVSACMAAFVNKYGVHVNISLRGKYTNGADLPVSLTESTSWWLAEGCFFGNLFDGTGVFSAPAFPHTQWPALSYSSVRACGLFEGQNPGCAPMQTNVATSCGAICTGSQIGYDEYGNNGGAWSSCSYGGKTYPALTTYILQANLDQCGDGICGPSEQPHSASTGKGCWECGTVP